MFNKYTSYCNQVLSRKFIYVRDKGRGWGQPTASDSGLSSNTALVSARCLSHSHAGSVPTSSGPAEQETPWPLLVGLDASASASRLQEDLFRVPASRDASCLSPQWLPL